MSVKVTWTVKCDVCGKEVVTEEKWSFWQDALAPEPDDWDLWLDVPEEYRDHPTSSICDACPECQVNPDWERYRKNWQEAV